MKTEEIVLKELIHKSCGKPAYLFIDRDYQVNEVIRASWFRHLDGSEVDPGDIICESCRAHIDRLYLNDDGEPYAK